MMIIRDAQLPQDAYGHLPQNGQIHDHTCRAVLVKEPARLPEEWVIVERRLGVLGPQGGLRGPMR